MADKRDLDAKKRAQVERLQRFGKHMQERRGRGETIPRWQTQAHPAYPVVLGIMEQDGLTVEDLDKPLIGIANSFSEVTPGHLHLRGLADAAKQGIREMGAVPMEFGTGAPCDAFGNANPGYRYILPMLENIGRNKAGKSNWQTWHNAAMMWGGALVEDPAWIERAVLDRGNGFYDQMKVSVSAFHGSSQKMLSLALNGERQESSGQ